jgi:hypothetical protein
MDDPEIASTTNSLMPIELQGTAFSDEAAAMNRGKGITLAGFVSAAVAGSALFLVALGNLDHRQAYLDAGSQLETVRADGFQKFWNCALIDTNQSLLRSADDVEAELNRRIEHFGAAYGAHLKRCASNLGALEHEVGTLAVPVALANQTRAIELALATTRATLNDVVSYLAHEGDDYDPAAAKLYVGKLALSWDELRRSHGAFRAALRKQLE